MYEMVAGENNRGYVTYHLSLNSKNTLGYCQSITLGSVKSRVPSVGTIPEINWLVAPKEFTTGKL